MKAWWELLMCMSLLLGASLFYSPASALDLSGVWATDPALFESGEIVSRSQNCLTYTAVDSS